MMAADTFYLDTFEDFLKATKDIPGQVDMRAAKLIGTPYDWNESGEVFCGKPAHHAWFDAIAIGRSLDQQFGINKAKEIYEGFDLKIVTAFERPAENEIVYFLKREERVRVAFMETVAGESVKVLFLTLAIIGCLRAKWLWGLREANERTFTPHGGYRVQTGSLYQFSQKVSQGLSYDWPVKIFEEIELKNRTVKDQST
jgi:hypothetical protein